MFYPKISTLFIQPTYHLTMLPKRAVVCMMWMGFCGGEVKGPELGTADSENSIKYTKNIPSTNITSMAFIAKMAEYLYKYDAVKSPYLIARQRNQTDYINKLKNQLMDEFNPNDPYPLFLYLLPDNKSDQWSKFMTFFASECTQITDFISKTAELIIDIKNLEDLRKAAYEISGNQFTEINKSKSSRILLQNAMQGLKPSQLQLLLIHLLKKLQDLDLMKALKSLATKNSLNTTMLEWVKDNVKAAKGIILACPVSKLQSKECKYAIASYFTSVQMKNDIHLLRTEMNLTPKKSFT